jgi:hypothetical protein
LEIVQADAEKDYASDEANCQECCYNKPHFLADTRHQLPLLTYN